MPLSDADQTCLDFRLLTKPSARVFSYDLPSGRVHHFGVRRPHSYLIVETESLVVTHRHDALAGMDLIEPDFGYYLRDEVRQRYAEYLTPTERVPLVPEADGFAAEARSLASPSSASFLVELTRLLQRRFAYAPGVTHVDTSLREVLDRERGVCQDFAHLMLAICRRQGIPARYISGYLYTGHRPAAAAYPGIAVLAADSAAGVADDDSAFEPGMSALVSGDAMHAWVECLLPDGNWYGFDPTNSTVANDYYVKVHSGRDYGDVPPLRGIYHGPACEVLHVAVRVHAEATAAPRAEVGR